MSPSKRWRVEAALVVFFAVVLLGGGAAFYFVSLITPVHSDPAAVPSTVAAEPAARYSSAVGEARRLARALLVEENLPGLSVAVAVQGETVWAEGFGYADVDRRATVTPLTRFRTGSVSKTLTATGVARLYDRGRIDLDAPVQRYAPRYPQKPWVVTPRQLLGDVAGVHRIRGDNNDNVPRGHCASVNAALETFAEEPLLFEPGTQYRFSTYGWILLSMVIEGAAGESFGTFMHREVFTPLGMDRTALEGTHLERAGRTAESDDDPTASFYSPKAAMGVNLGVDGAPAADYSCFFGAGAFLSTPSDLVRLGSAMLKPGFLRADTITLLQTPLQLESGASTGFALGWKVDRVQLAGAPVRVVHHRASFIGGTVSLSVFPDLGLVVAAAANISQSDRVDPFALQVAASFAATEKR